ncbi:DNA cytosine methyltransferase [Agrobacterium pusense]|uniref:DNA (cytosine-5-)-methyltransferase n=1 Tax=Agrobacterium pusense TaxID=648995 RepID=A0A6H0ZL61_9HYPH|nr:DNA cytosine methyltransferase [Agrobacterium pusense]QIX20787.1 DNA cytosine methyltransferase [Agrobacterium pusense]WCK22754.1 DNA cytosine methyltransferase [Agrobacterium pusense]
MQHANDNHTGLRFLSVCSGIEAASVAWHPLGWKAVAFSEIEKFPSAVLKYHYPDVPNLGDFTKIDTKTLGRVDILAGGTPCQAFSVAGLRGGLNDERGNLTLKFVELAHELAANNGLRNAVWENVVGVLSDKGNAFGCFLAGLVGANAPIQPPGRWTSAGMVSGPRGRAAWRVLDAQYFGVAQRRRRVLVVADFGNGADPAKVLLIEQGLPRHPPARGEARKDIAPTISALTKGGGGLGTDFDLDGGLVAGALTSGNGPGGGWRIGPDEAVANHIVTHAPEMARCVTTREGSSQDYETTTMVAVSVTGDVAHTLKAEGADASEDGTGRGTPIVAFVQNSRDEVRLMNGDGQIVGALAAEPGAKQQCYLAQSVAIRGRDGGATAELGGDIATALRASQGGGDKPHVLATRDVAGAITSNYGKQFDNSDTAIGPNVANHHSAVRRLTPVECERLQGFPDGYTDIPWRGKPNSPDGPRYRALGNSWAVPKFVWLGERIQKLMPVANDNQETPIANAA